jgi:hypothetical protein
MARKVIVPIQSDFDGHQRTLPSSGSVSSFAKMRSEPGIKFIATRFAPVEVAVASCARLACMSIRWDINADGEADHRGAVAFGRTNGRITPRSSAALRRSDYFCTS